MAVRNIPPLVADSGSLTIMRRTSTYVYGAWQVSLPDGVNYTEQAELTSTEQAYVYRPPNRPTGRFGLGFVRQDANIYIDKISKKGTPSGTSNVELQMDIGQRRGAGRALVEREITARGLGSLVPGVDFTTGDIVPVLIWGKIVHLPVTALDWRSGVDGNVGWSVQCGGQLIWDGEQLRSQIDEVQKQLDRERREREREEQRMKEQAETDRRQTSRIDSQQSQINTWSRTATTNANLSGQLVRELSSAFYLSGDTAGFTQGALEQLDRVIDQLIYVVNELNTIALGNDKKTAVKNVLNSAKLNVLLFADELGSTAYYFGQSLGRLNAMDKPGTIPQI